MRGKDIGRPIRNRETASDTPDPVCSRRGILHGKQRQDGLCAAFLPLRRQSEPASSPHVMVGKE